jgi:hypothetical protein
MIYFRNSKYESKMYYRLGKASDEPKETLYFYIEAIKSDPYNLDAYKELEPIYPGILKTYPG